MNLLVHDTVTLLEPLFCEPSPPRERLERARPVLYDEKSVFQKLKLIARAQRSALFQVMQAGALDGYSVVAAQQGWGLFNPSRRLEASAWTFRQFRKNNLLKRMRDVLETAATPLAQQLPETLHVFLLPADPADRALMLRSHGLSVFAGLPDALLIQLWPSEGNLARLDPVLTRALVHVGEGRGAEVLTLREVLRREGRAAELLSERFPTLPEPQLVAFHAPEDWEKALAHAATLCGAETYDALKANIYGGDGSSIVPVPEIQTLDKEERVYVQAVLQEAGDEIDPAQIASYLYGDEVVETQGHAGMGIPPFGGVAVLPYFYPKRG